MYLWRGCPLDAPVELLTGVHIHGLAVSESHGLAVTERGQVYECPATGHPQLCRPLTGQFYIFTIITNVTKHLIKCSVHLELVYVSVHL